MVDFLSIGSFQDSEAAHTHSHTHAHSHTHTHTRTYEIKQGCVIYLWSFFIFVGYVCYNILQLE